MILKKRIIFLLFSILPALAVSTYSQTTRVYVASASGNDANSCTASSPCRSVTKALSAVDPGGEVVLTESGDYDPFLIGKSVTIAAADGINAGIISSGGGSAIFINNTLQPTDTVSFRNLHIVGAGSPQTSDGIINSFAGTLNVDNCVFTGLNNALTMSNVAGQLFVHHTTIRSSLFGIGLIGPSGEGLLRATIDGSNFESDDTGISMTGKVLANIRNSVLANNTSRGLQIRSTVANQRAEALVDNCQVNYNTAGILVGAANGGFAVLRLSRSTITGNLLSGISIGTNGTAFTLGNNVVTGNFPDISGGTLTALAAK